MVKLVDERPAILAAMIRLLPLDVEDDSTEGCFLQSAFWARFKGLFGWSTRYFEFSLEGGGAEKSGRIRILLRKIVGPLCFAYVAGGPKIDPGPTGRSAFLADLGRALKAELPRSCVFLRFDCPWYEAEIGKAESPETIRSRDFPYRANFGLPLLKSASDTQPPDSVVLELSQEEGTLLAGMKAKWRYNIRLAEKKGIIVKDEGLSGLDEFWRLYEETARRDRIAIHPKNYYEGLFKVCSDSGGLADLRLWVARHEGQALAAIITLFYGRVATYLYGASSDYKRSFMPAYALQWTAIRAAKSASCLHYDFYGIPPRDEPDHPMSGLYRFKTGFGGTVVHYPGSWDYPFRFSLYLMWRVAESIRDYWFKVLLKSIARKPAPQRVAGESH